MQAPRRRRRPRGRRVCCRPSPTLAPGACGRTPPRRPPPAALPEARWAEAPPSPGTAVPPVCCAHSSSGRRASVDPCDRVHGTRPTGNDMHPHIDDHSSHTPQSPADSRAAPALHPRSLSAGLLCHANPMDVCLQGPASSKCPETVDKCRQTHHHHHQRTCQWWRPCWLDSVAPPSWCHGA